jgi:hypothetical protein
MNEIKSTLPAKIGGAEITRFNALRHGLLSRYTLHIRAPLGSAPRRRDPETPSRVGRTSSDRDRSSQAPVAFRAAYPLPSGSTLKLGNMLPFGQRPGDRPIYPRRRAV